MTSVVSQEAFQALEFLVYLDLKKCDSVRKSTRKEGQCEKECEEGGTVRERVRGRRDSGRKSARKEGQWEKECEKGGTMLKKSERREEQC